MPCSARMIWKGYSFKCNKPEARRYSLWLNGTRENPYLRRHGLRCLLDHEIGTHFYRSYNDGFQPWFYDRKKFGLRGVGSFESLCTEEGLASVNTTLRAREKYLWLSALTYYTACKSTEMTFKQLFDHLGQFVDNPEQRWKHVMRVKRGLVDPNDLGGYGKDQCYFEGAVSILRNIDDINFNLLMSGKICYDEVSRVKRLARLGSVCLPAIMRDMNSYRKQLKKMAVINGLHLPHPMHEPPKAYVQRLRERQAGVRRRRKVRKNKKLRSSPSKVSVLQTAEPLTSFNSAKQQSAKPRKAATDTESALKEAGSRDEDSSSEGQEACVGVRDSPSGTSAFESSATPTDPGSTSAQHVCCSSAEDPLTSPEVSGVKSVPDSWVYAQNRGSQVQAPVLRKPRPHTALELSTSRLPPLHPCKSENMNGNSKDAAVFYIQSEGGDCSLLYGGLCHHLCREDSSSDEDLSPSEEEEVVVESWLPALPPSSPTPSSHPGHTPPHLPPIVGQDGRSGSKVSADGVSATPGADSCL